MGMGLLYHIREDLAREMLNDMMKRAVIHGIETEYIMKDFEIFEVRILSNQKKILIEDAEFGMDYCEKERAIRHLMKII